MGMASVKAGGAVLVTSPTMLRTGASVTKQVAQSATTWSPLCTICTRMMAGATTHCGFGVKVPAVILTRAGESCAKVPVRSNCASPSATKRTSAVAAAPEGSRAVTVASAGAAGACSVKVAVVPPAPSSSTMTLSAASAPAVVVSATVAPAGRRRAPSVSVTTEAPSASAAGGSAVRCNDGAPEVGVTNDSSAVAVSSTLTSHTTVARTVTGLSGRPSSAPSLSANSVTRAPPSSPSTAADDDNSPPLDENATTAPGAPAGSVAISVVLSRPFASSTVRSARSVKGGGGAVAC